MRVSVIGNRPQLMKLIPELSDVVLWTGQHYTDALKNAYTEQLEQCGAVMDLSQTAIPEMTAAIIEAVLLDSKPELLTVYGDTSSTLAGALAARHLGVELAHVEAGLRCGNELLPEERNRIVVDSLANVNFCPTIESTNNCGNNVFVGDIMQERLYEMWQSEFGGVLPINDAQKWLVTIHRAENSGADVMARLIKDVCFYVNNPVVFLHPKAEALFRKCEKLRLKKLTSAVSYLHMLRELWNCEGVITDSGGLMREAAWLGKKCIVLRSECEFPELVTSRRIVLVGQSEEKLRDALQQDDWRLRVELENPNTTQRILEHLGIPRRSDADTASQNVVCNASVSD